MYVWKTIETSLNENFPLSIDEKYYKQGKG